MSAQENAGLELMLIDSSQTQVTSVSQLLDVQPTDWVFVAVQSLVERYSCLEGYPSHKYFGTRVLSRYEFASGLNACINHINQLLTSGFADKVSQEDLAALQKLQGEFAIELAGLKDRIDTLEAKTTTLESQQFSPITKLNGEAILAIAGVITGDNAKGETITDRNLTFSNRIRLSFDTSFTGKDLLRVRLQARNVVPLGGRNSGATLTNEGRLVFDGSSNNQFELDTLRYRFPLGDSTTIYAYTDAEGFFGINFTSQFNPFLDSSGEGAISRFARRNAIFSYAGGGGGLAISQKLGTNLTLELGYFASNPSNPSQSNGLFGGKYQALGQLVFKPTRDLTLGLTYSNAFSPSGNSFGPSVGSNLANSNAGAAIANTYGFQGFWRITKGLGLSGWVGYANHRYLGKGDASVWNWAIALSFPDLGKEGNLAGLVVGMEPKVTSVSAELDLGRGKGIGDRDTSFHIEAFYRYAVSKNISITPGLIWLTAPNHDERNSDILIAAIRTTFSF
ncbi:iron uptake porin [Synechococcus sp. PCC 7502]|uniref:iron uptake porin n=1 Tax=Synechococcus sp. PCC 7502 TaxID=1173263 RepID=UPI0014391970|nr:iron uptake porin [Synechococcus sp. PCC 7502]